MASFLVFLLPASCLIHFPLLLLLLCVILFPLLTWVHQLYVFSPFYQSLLYIVVFLHNFRSFCVWSLCYCVSSLFLFFLPFHTTPSICLLIFLRLYPPVCTSSTFYFCLSLTYLFWVGHFLFLFSFLCQLVVLSVLFLFWPPPALLSPFISPLSLAVHLHHVSQSRWWCAPCTLPPPIVLPPSCVSMLVIWAAPPCAESRVGVWTEPT